MYLPLTSVIVETLLLHDDIIDVAAKTQWRGNNCYPGTFSGQLILQETLPLMPLLIVFLDPYLGTFSATSLGSGSGDVSIVDVEGESTFTLDGSNFGGTIDVAALTAAGNTTVSMGSEGYFSASVIGTAGSFTLDGAAATTGQATIQGISAGGAITVSMGAGTGAVTLISSVTTGNFTLDASTFGGAIDITSVTASGSIVSVGTNGDLVLEKWIQRVHSLWMLLLLSQGRLQSPAFPLMET